MKILLLGNGFDLEHALHTKYTDFLDFVQECQRIEREENYTDNQYSIFFKNYDVKYQYLLNDLTFNNFWILYFKRRLEINMLLQKGHWIDFEREISNFIKRSDTERKYDSRKRLCFDLLKKSNYIDIDLDYKNMIELLLFDLNRLILALELYIDLYVDNNENNKYYNENILEISPDKIISFNYSHTFQNIYGILKKDVECFFIHGEAKINTKIIDTSKVIKPDFTNNKITLGLKLDKGKICENYKLIEELISKNNMVLGIDEYLEEDYKNNQLDFVDFKKYFQRIFKKTGNTYKKWIDEIDSNKKEKHELYIFGHSLDNTDGDILRELILRENIRTKVFYFEEDQFHQQIINLIKVIKQDNVIEKVYGKSPTIVFEKQKTKKDIHGTSFEILTDITKIRNLNSYSNNEIKSIFMKLDKNIESKSIDYFVSQENIITLFDELQKIGIQKKYRKSLLEMACLLNDNQKLKIHSYNQWDYVDYTGAMICDMDTKKFIQIINKYNNKYYVGEDVESINDIDLYRRMIDKKEKISEERYVEVINEIIEKMDTNVSTYQNLLIEISINCTNKFAKKVLQRLIDNEDDNLKIIRYDYILDNIYINEYIVSQYENDY